MVISQGGIVSSSQTLASEAGAQILARGGSAVDAAIAVNAVLGVVEPMMNGIGGDLFAMHWDAKTKKLSAINSSGWSPKGLSLEFLKKEHYYSMPSGGIHTVTVPGCVSGWKRMHEKFGRLPWEQLFRPAIYFAEHGFPVTEIIQFDWDAYSSKLEADANAKRVFLPGGRAPKVGEVFRNPELAKALRLIAAGGADAFYRGPIAKAILATSKRLGGTMDAADLAEFQAEWVQPISTEYRGWKVSELPPNGQGIGALMMLNVMENFPLAGADPLSADVLHYKIESQKLAFQDHTHFVGDPRLAWIPQEGMLSKEYAKQRAATVQIDTANCQTTAGNPPGAGHGDTVYLSVVDRDGNIVSWIQSISDAFGSGVVVDGMGFHLHDRGGAFSFDEHHPNALAPRKRPFHTIIPGFMEKDDLHIGFGIMRGMNQAQAQAQFVSNVVDHGMNLQAALEAPRFTRPTLAGCVVKIEGRVPLATRIELEKRGHLLEVQGDYSGFMGGGQAVLHDSRTHVNYGASSPRKDGASIPEPAPYFAK